MGTPAVEASLMDSRYWQPQVYSTYILWSFESGLGLWNFHYHKCGDISLETSTTNKIVFDIKRMNWTDNIGGIQIRKYLLTILGHEYDINLVLFLPYIHEFCTLCYDFTFRLFDMRLFGEVNILSYHHSI